MEKKPQSLWVRRPAQRDGKWVVIVADSQSPLAKEIEVVPFMGRERAWQGYRKIMKDLGLGY